MHVFRLTDFEGEVNEDYVRSKIDIKDHKLEKTKGSVFNNYLQDEFRSVFTQQTVTFHLSPPS